ncbi:hypothetical protein AAG747_18290 [Rapidithrix thailandica]|uniref:Uncharacterized protein n=1 Tax=Rapidithrix thailandica TaxID=413964 RepID=A0AAW9SG89_9BACT
MEENKRSEEQITKSHPPKRYEDEIDLREFFGYITKSIAALVGSVLNFFLRVILHFRYVIFRFWILFLLGTVLGGLAGFLYQQKSTPYFETNSTVKSKYLNGIRFISEINKLDILCQEGNYTELGKRLGLQPDEARSLKSIRAINFYDYYSLEEAFGNDEMLKDSLQMANKIHGEEFVLIMNMYRMGTGLEKIQKGLQSFIASNDYVAQNYKTSRQLLQEEKQRINHDLATLDTLKDRINQAVFQYGKNGSSSTLKIDLANTQSLMADPIKVYEGNLQLLERKQEIEKQLANPAKLIFINDFADFQQFGGLGKEKAIASGALYGFLTILIGIILYSLNQLLDKLQKKYIKV